MKNPNLRHSFYYAIIGIIHCYKNERNIRIHTLAGFFALLIGLYLGISRVEMIILIIMIALVVVAEIINTSIENVVDLFVDDYHPLAKIAKDIMAGAVMILAITSVIVGCIMFIPYILVIWG